MTKFKFFIIAGCMIYGIIIIALAIYGMNIVEGFIAELTDRQFEIDAISGGIRSDLLFAIIAAAVLIVFSALMLFKWPSRVELVLAAATIISVILIAGLQWFIPGLLHQHTGHILGDTAIYSGVLFFLSPLSFAEISLLIFGYLLVVMLLANASAVYQHSKRIRRD